MNRCSVFAFNKISTNAEFLLPEGEGEDEGDSLTPATAGRPALSHGEREDDTTKFAVLDSMKNIYFLNGKSATAEASLGFINSDAAGIFETLRVYNGKVFRIDEHLERLAESAQKVGLFTHLSSTVRRVSKK